MLCNVPCTNMMDIPTELSSILRPCMWNCAHIFFTSFCFWDRLQNDLLCVGWDVKPCFTPSHENICYKYNAIRNDQLTTSCSCERYLSNSNNEVRMPWMQRPICFRISEHFKKLGPFLAIKMGGVTKLKSILLVRNAEKSKRALNR